MSAFEHNWKPAGPSFHESFLPPFPPSHPGKGKEAALPDIDLPADNELSSDNSPLMCSSSSPNAAEAHSRKRSSRRPRRSVIVAKYRTRREPSRGQRPPMAARQYAPNPTGGLPQPLPSIYPPFGALPTPPPPPPPSPPPPPLHLKWCSHPPFGDHMIYFQLPLDSISWIKILPEAFPFHPSLCMMAPPIHMIICYIIIKQ